MDCKKCTYYKCGICTDTDGYKDKDGHEICRYNDRAIKYEKPCAFIAFGDAHLCDGNIKIAKDRDHMKA